MNGAALSQSAGLGSAPTTWTIVGTGDFDGDGKSDMLWRDGSGNVAIWFMNGTVVTVVRRRKCIHCVVDRRHG